MKTWKEETRVQKEAYASKAAKAKSEALAAKKAAKQAVDKAADFAKSKVSNSLGREAINEAERAARASLVGIQ